MFNACEQNSSPKGKWFRLLGLQEGNGVFIKRLVTVAPQFGASLLPSATAVLLIRNRPVGPERIFIGGKQTHC